MGLVGLPDPLSDDLAEAGAGVIQDDSERDSQQAGGVIRDLVRYGRGVGEAARGREAQTPVALRVCVWGQQAGCEPSDTAADRGPGDVPATGVEVVGRVGQCDCHTEPYYPWWDRHELSLHRLVPQPGHDGRGKEGK